MPAGAQGNLPVWQPGSQERADKLAALSCSEPPCLPFHALIPACLPLPRSLTVLPMPLTLLQAAKEHGQAAKDKASESAQAGKEAAVEAKEVRAAAAAASSSFGCRDCTPPARWALATFAACCNRQRTHLLHCSCLSPT
jgi:hypothetical protein